jgi:hypothetical protein
LISRIVISAGTTELSRDVLSAIIWQSPVHGVNVQQRQDYLCEPELPGGRCPPGLRVAPCLLCRLTTNQVRMEFGFYQHQPWRWFNGWCMVEAIGITQNQETRSNALMRTRLMNGDTPAHALALLERGKVRSGWAIRVSRGYPASSHSLQRQSFTNNSIINHGGLNFTNASFGQFAPGTHFQYFGGT